MTNSVWSPNELHNKVISKYRLKNRIYCNPAFKGQLFPIKIIKKNFFFSVLQVGPVLSVSHGMGVPSVGILLHEMIKLMYHAKCKDPVFIRIGTCGGIGVEGGTVIISEEVVDGLLRNTYEMVSDFI